MSEREMLKDFYSTASDSDLLYILHSPKYYSDLALEVVKEEIEKRNGISEIKEGVQNNIDNDEFKKAEKDAQPLIKKDTLKKIIVGILIFGPIVLIFSFSWYTCENEFHTGSGFFTYILLGSIFAIFYDMYKNKKEKSANIQKKSNLDKALSKYPSFNKTKLLEGINSTLALDGENKKVFLIMHDSDGINYKDSKLINFSDILSCEIIKDGITVTKTSRGSQIVGTVIGGAIMGGAGAIIGGLSGKKTSSEKLSYVILQLGINGINDPVFKIEPYYIFKDKNYTYKEPNLNEAEEWLTIFKIIMKQSDLELRTDDKNNFPIADELTKLSDLKIKGIITEDEFQIQKKKLLER